MNKDCEERFWSKVQRHPTDCWLWLSASKSRGGYGMFWLNGKYHIATRIAYELTYGEAPGDLVVRHKCDNPQCVRPSHLELGTHKDNTRDAIERGRFTPGKYNSRPRTADEKARISAALTGRKLTAESIAKRTTSRAGYKHSEETKQKMRHPHRKGNS